MLMPAPRGPLSGWILSRLTTDPDRAGSPPPPVRDDPAGGDDLHLALYVSYRLHDRGVDGVDERWEWHPALLSFRAELERAFGSALRELVAGADPVGPGPIGARLGDVIRADDGPSLSAFLEREGTLERYREFLQHRSAYQLMEADPHSWAIPRLEGASKVALLEIQADEYGGGDLAWMHSELFGATMRAMDLDPTFGAYLDRLPGPTLAGVNLMSMFGLHRRHRGALVGHLAAFEMTSCIPNRRYANGLRRLGLGPEVTTYFDEHVEADAVHGSVAADDLAGSLVAAEPGLEDDVLFGARALLALEARSAGHMLSAWRAQRTSLLELPSAA
jgi:hypothetical protein